MKRTTKRIIHVLFSLIFIGIILFGGTPGTQAGEIFPEGAPQQTVPLLRTQRVGAYFFYWYALPDQSGLVPPETYFASYPPGVIRNSGTVSVPPYEAEYEGGPYNTVYYNASATNGNGDPQRWWEWQFRDMAEAGLDFAVLNSWDGATFFPRDTQLSSVGPYLNGALDALGNPLQIALYDDTTSEVTVPEGAKPRAASPL